MELADVMPLLMMGNGSSWMAALAALTMLFKLLERMQLDRMLVSKFKTLADALFTSKVRYELTSETFGDHNIRVSSDFGAVAFAADCYLKSAPLEAWKEVVDVKEVHVWNKGIKVSLFTGTVRMPRIDMEVTHVQEFMGEKKDKERVKWSIVLLARSYGDITDFVEKCRDSLDAHVDSSSSDRKQMLYSVKEVRPGFVRYNVERFRSTKTFANLFFPGKEDLIRKLDRFENDPESYERIGKPYKQFWMFHSLPGCAKSSAIKCIANYTQRHVVLLGIDKFRTVAELCDCISHFSSENSVPLSRCMFVIEEFDCWTSKPNRAKPAQDDDPPIVSDGEKLVAALKEINTSSCSEKPVETPEVATGIMLNMFDGIKEMYGAMVIFTSNRPELFDAALTRPGRIDKFEFKRLSPCHVNEYWRLHFEKDLPDDLRDAMVGRTEFVTVAELSAILDAADPAATMRAFLQAAA
jgi:ATPase family associated with various cellular activities (AAA)